MKTLKTLLALTASATLAISANANLNYGAGDGGVYVGVKVGQIDADKPKNATAYGAYAGYNFNRNFGVEAEYVGSDEKEYDIGNIRHRYDAKSYGAYATYRYQLPTMPVYLKGKLGVAKTEVDGIYGKISENGILKDAFHTNPDDKFSSDKTSLAGGVGVGFQATQNIGIEATYNYLNKDNSMWGVGAGFSF